jgi:hypothetical protein
MDSQLLIERCKYSFPSYFLTSNIPEDFISLSKFQQLIHLWGFLSLLVFEKRR